MTSHLSSRQVEGYRQRSLSPRELLAVDDHLAGCADCRLRVAEGEPLAAALEVWESLGGETGQSVELDRRSATARWRPARWTQPALWAAALLLAVGLTFWLAVPPLRREVDSLRAEVRRLERRSAAVERLARPPEIADLLAAGAVLRGPAAAAAELAPRSPVATAVRDGRPTFRWTPLAGAEWYRVAVFDRDFRAVADSGPLSTTEWTPERPLPAGAVYAWQVKVRRGGAELTAPGPTAPQARFRVLPADRAAASARAARATGGAHLALGLLYARAGLLDDAERELTAALHEDAGSEETRELLATVRSWRRMPP